MPINLDASICLKYIPRQDGVHNLWDPGQNKNVDPLFKTREELPLKVQNIVFFSFLVW